MMRKWHMAASNRRRTKKNIQKKRCGHGHPGLYRAIPKAAAGPGALRDGARRGRNCGGKSNIYIGVAASPRRRRIIGHYSIDGSLR